jgi:glyoxylate carboligase
MLLLFLGMEVIDRALIHTQAINEVVLYDKALAKARRMGKELAKAVKTGDISYHGEAGICPICQDRVLRILRDDKTVECGVCGIRGKIVVEEGKVRRVTFTPSRRTVWIVSGKERDYRPYGASGEGPRLLLSWLAD